MGHKQHKQKQRGNVLFLILLAVVLFAGFSFAVTDSLKGGDTAEDENRALDSTVIVEYARTIKSAINNIRLLNDCNDEDISFEHASYGHTDYDHSPASTTDCQVFHTDGGGVTRQIGGSKLSNLEWEFIGDVRVDGIGTTLSGATSSDRDLIIALPGLDEKTCQTLNDELNNNLSSIPVNTGDIIDSSYRFDGTFPTSGDDLTATSDLYAACFRESSGSEYYIFYSVLIAR